MKAGTTDSIKFKRLARRLNLPSWQAVGLLESLWQMASRDAVRGDIGRYSDEDIAVYCDWPNGRESEFIDCLVECGWLDRCAEHRLVVHDWAEHAPNYIKGGLARKKVGFASVVQPGDDEKDFMGEPRDEPQDVPKDAPKLDAKPTPTKPSLVKPSLAKSSQDNTVDTVNYSDAFQTWWSSYPASRRVEKKATFAQWNLAVNRIASTIGIPGTLRGESDRNSAITVLLEAVRKFADSSKARGDPRYILHPKRWLRNEIYNDDPATWEISGEQSTDNSRYTEGATF